MSKRRFSSDDTVIFGAGGHGKVVLSIARQLGLRVSCLVDADRTKSGSLIFSVPVVHEDDFEVSGTPAMVIAVGDNEVREKISMLYSQRARWLTLVHPNAWIDPNASLGEGSVVCAGAIIQPDARIGKHVIVNTNASVDHDCVIADFVHLAPGVALSGGVRVGKRSFLGTGSAARQFVSIGDDITIGVGGVVIRHLTEPGTYTGVPVQLSRK